MNFEFDDPDLERLYYDRSFTGGYPEAVVKGFRKRMQTIKAADDERTLRAQRGARLEKLKGDRAGQYSLRINDQWRLIIEIRGNGATKRIGIIEIVDYH